MALYDRELAGVRNHKALELAASPPEDPITWTLRTETGAEALSFDKPDGFAKALKKAIAEVTDIERLFGLWEQYVETVRAL